MLTVCELIERLKTYPPGAVVLQTTDEADYVPLVRVRPLRGLTPLMFAEQLTFREIDILRAAIAKSNVEPVVLE